MLAYILSVVLLKAYSLCKTQRKCTYEYNKFPFLLQNSGDFFFRTFISLEKNILKFRDFSRFSMTVDPEDSQYTAIPQPRCSG